MATKTYTCRFCGEQYTDFGKFGRHLKTCPKRTEKIPPGKKSKKAKEVSKAEAVKDAKSPGFTTVTVTPVQKEIKVKPRPKARETDEVEIKPIQEKIRREEWSCLKCMYRWYPSQRPGKCPNCGSPRIQVRAVEEQLDGAPMLDEALFRPLVAFPYDLWAERSHIEELRLSPAEVDILSKNMASVCNYYMADWMREHGVIVAMVMAVAVVSIPKMYIYQSRKREREETPPEKPILEDIAQPEEKLGTTSEEEVEEPKPKPTQNEIDRRISKAFGVEK